MASSANVLVDGSLLSRLDQRLERVERVFALFSGLFIFSLMFLAVYSVGGRKFFASPLVGYVDLIESAMPFIAILGIAWVQRDGTHIRMDLVVGRLKGRALWAAELISVLLILALILALIWGSWAHFQRSFDWNAPLWSRDSTIDVNLPVWPTKLVVPVAFSVMALRLLIQIWGFGRALILGLPSPVAVPLVQDAAEQARAEAEQLEGRD